MRHLLLLAVSLGLLAAPAEGLAARRAKPAKKAAAARAAPKKADPAPAPKGEEESPIPDEQVFPFETSVTTLPNGLTLVFVPFDSPGLTAFYSVVRTGSRNEVEPGRSGFAHFFEHMMFRGTKKVPSQVYEDRLAKAGVAHNAFTTDDFTAYHNFGPTSQLPLVIELEADRFQNLEYSEDDFRTEAKAVLGEYNKNFANPLQKMEEALQDTAFTAHSYKHTTMGFRRDIEAMPSMYAYSLEFFKRWYTPDNTFLVVVGDFEPRKTEALIQQAYGSWGGKAAGLAPAPEPKQSARKTVHVSWPNPTQSRLILAWHTPEARVETRASAVQNVLSPYLFGPTSPAYRDLVLERQLAVDLSGGYYDHRDPTLFSVIATLKSPEAFAEVEKTLLASVAKLRGGEVDEERLEDVKSNQKYGVLNSFDTAPNVALQLVFALGPTGNPEALNVLLNRIEEVSPAPLVDFAKRYFVDSNVTRVTLGGPGIKAPADAKEYSPAPPAQGSGPTAAAVKGGAK